MKISSTSNHYARYNIPPKTQTTQQSPSFLDAFVKSMDYVSHQTSSAKLEQKHIELSRKMHIPVEFLRWVDLSDPDVEMWTNGNLWDLGIWMSSFFYSGITVEEINRLNVFSESALSMEAQHILIYQFALHMNTNREHYNDIEGCIALATNRRLIEFMDTGIITLEALITAPWPNIVFVDFEMHYNPNRGALMSCSGWIPLAEALADPSLMSIPFPEGGFAEWWEYFWERLAESDTEMSEQTRQLLKQLQATLGELHS